MTEAAKTDTTKPARKTAVRKAPSQAGAKRIVVTPTMDAIIKREVADFEAAQGITITDAQAVERMLKAHAKASHAPDTAAE